MNFNFNCSGFDFGTDCTNLYEMLCQLISCK